MVWVYSVMIGYHFQIIMSTIDEADCLVSSMIIKEQDSTTDSMPDPEPGPEPISDPVRTFAMPAHLGEQVWSYCMVHVRILKQKWSIIVELEMSPCLLL